MERHDLRQYSGKHVTVILNGEQSSAPQLDAAGPYKAFITVAQLAPNWTRVAPYVLTDEDVANLSPDSSGGLIGKIFLKSDGNSLTWDEVTAKRA